MTALEQHLPAPANGTDYAALAARFRPIFSRIAETSVERERNRTLPHEPIQWLKEAGFGAVRVPVEHGGGGASLPQLFQLLIELAAADSNVPQALRGHFAFVEDRLNAHASAPQDVWFQRFVAGDLVGCAWTEIGAVKIGDVITRVSRQGEQWVVNGTKYYSTGSLFSDWIDLFARRDDTGADVIAAIRTRQPGVRQSDDWDGFGQRTTGSGTSVFENAVVEEENIIDFGTRFKYQTAFYQLVLLAVITGSGTSVFENAVVEEENIIDFGTRFKYQTAFYQLVLLAVITGSGRAAVRDFSHETSTRTRVFSHGNGAAVSQDPQVLQVIGKASGQVYAAEAATLRAAEASQQAYLARFANDPAAEQQANVLAELESAQAQVAAIDLVLRATSDLFNALGASTTSTSRQLDRHWRNARTAASHNPVIYKERIVGDWHVNGAEPPYVWQIGGGAKQP